jgi:hypothetical protein
MAFERVRTESHCNRTGTAPCVPAFFVDPYVGEIGVSNPAWEGFSEKP